MNSDRRGQLMNSLGDKAYRDAFVEANITNDLAFQIRALRDRHGWTQAEIGERVGMAQETISLFESGDYGRFTLRSLKRLASVFDVALLVRFAAFDELADWVLGLSEEKLAPASFPSEAAVSVPGKPITFSIPGSGAYSTQLLASVPPPRLTVRTESNSADVAPLSTPSDPVSTGMIAA